MCSGCTCRQGRDTASNDSSFDSSAFRLQVHRRTRCTLPDKRAQGLSTQCRPTHQWRWRSEWRPSLSVISAAFIALGRSCLLAKTSSTASRSSSCTNTVNAPALPPNNLPCSPAGCLDYPKNMQKAVFIALTDGQYAWQRCRKQAGKPRSASGAAHRGPRRCGRGRCCPPRR